MSVEGGFLILDFGSQYTQLIARRLRELGVYSELLPFDASLEEIKQRKPQGLVLSGGPSSVNEPGAPQRPDLKELLELAPSLGVCYGMQLISAQFGGRVVKASDREYGLSEMSWSEPLSARLGSDEFKKQQVWMSHGDVVEQAPEGFRVVALSEQGHAAALKSDRIWCVQFHPEVTHTEGGTEILKSFVFDLCGAKSNWQAPSIVEHLLEDIRLKVPKGEKVLCALSGGVDSTVVGTLLTKALGPEQVHCVFVDTGLLRQGEFEQVLKDYENLGLNVHGVQAASVFLERLQGVADPEQKRKIIGHSFIDVFKDAVKHLEEPMQWLAQGTLYPDVIESVSLRGSSVTIKSHHNVGGLPKDLGLKLIEPLRELFKDEVRAIGEQLGIARLALWRHPFPGPGLAIRVLGEVTEKDLKVLRQADAIYIEELKNHGLYEQIWQAFSVLLPVYSVGVQGDARTYEKVLALRAVTSQDGMTADWFDFPASFLRKVSNRITNQVEGINRVVYDVTSKPPGTIEWE